MSLGVWRGVFKPLNSADN